MCTPVVSNCMCSGRSPFIPMGGKFAQLRLICQTRMQCLSLQCSVVCIGVFQTCALLCRAVSGTEVDKPQKLLMCSMIILVVMRRMDCEDYVTFTRISVKQQCRQYIVLMATVSFLGQINVIHHSNRISDSQIF